MCLLSVQLFPLDFVIDNFFFYYFSDTKYSMASQSQHYISPLPSVFFFFEVSLIISLQLVPSVIRRLHWE